MWICRDCAAVHVLVIQSLNEIFNANEKRRAALDVPQIVIGLLAVVALGALGFIAYGTA